MNEFETQIYEFDQFRIDLSKRQLTKGDGKTVPLTPKVFDTLIYLVRHGGKVIGKDELMREIWTDAIVEENNLTQNISILRKIFGEKPGEHRFIVTVAGHGYRFVPEVREVLGASGAASSEIDPSELQDEAQSKSEPAIRSPNPEAYQSPIAKNGKSTRLRLAAVFSAFFVGLILLGSYIWSETDRYVAAPFKTIAVLPFKPLVLENRSEALELGMTETLINKISASEAIIVRPLGSVRRYSNPEQDVLLAGRELGVDSVLEGTIQTSGERIRIAARLVRTMDGKQLWTETFDEKFSDIFSVQDSISNKVLAALTLKLSNEGLRRLTKHDTVNVEAYQLYMKGRFHAARLILPEATKGIEYFNQAIALDANYALAYVGIAQAYTGFSLSGDVPANEAMPKAKAAALRAVELDPNLPESQVAVGFLAFWYDWDWSEAEKRYQRALELDPNNAAGHYFYAHLNSNLGRHVEALTMVNRARELDPLSPLINSAEGQFLFFAGNSDEAVSRLTKTLELYPNFWHTHLVLSGIFSDKKMFDEAITEGQEAARFSGGNSQAIAAKGYALAKSGNRDQARIVLAELHKLSTKKYVPASSLAIVYNGLGETETALDYLEKGFAERNVLMAFLKVDPKWNNLRNESRFANLMRRMNFS